jgi:restriction system protein
VKEVAPEIVAHFGLSDALATETLPDGRNRLIHRLEWARTYLKKAGLLEYPTRGAFQITQRGLSVLKEKPSRIDSKYLERYPEFIEFRKNSQSASVTTHEDSQPVDPEEAIETGYQALRSQVEVELLDRIKKGTPEFFEQTVVDLLIRMGYGGSRKEAGRAIGKSGDEGIDGVIDEDALGLDVVYIQAKRWTNQSVGRQQIQQFVGALQGKRAKKGIFITTSEFAASAREYVKNIENRVVLIDGAMLASLMFQHDIGVTEQKSYRLKKIDTDYFEE